MAHVAKRPRIHGPKNPVLTLSSTSSLLESTRQATSTTPKLRNLQLEHENSLRQSAQRLKSSWEDICRRYARDFDGEGDEIDLETGQVVVDNGHLRNLTEQENDTWAMDGFDEEDAGSATSTLEMEILGMRPILGRDDMGGPMLKDDEAEEIDVDEMEVDRDAIDDLFDELEELTMTASGKAKVDEKKRREKEQKVHEIESPAVVAGLDSIPSPASSEPMEEESSSTKFVTKEAEKHGADLPSPEEFPPDTTIMGSLLSKLGVDGVLALVNQFADKAKPADLEGETFAAQLTPVSECGRPLAELLADEAERLAMAKEPTPISPSLLPAEEQTLLDEEEVEDKEPEMLEKVTKEESELEVEPTVHVVDPTVRIEDNTENRFQEIPVAAVSDINGDANVSGTIQRETLDQCTESMLGSLQRPLALDDTPAPSREDTPAQDQNIHKPIPQAESIPLLNQLPESESGASANESLPESSEPEANDTTKERPVSKEEELDPNYLYGDIDDLSTIITPKRSVPVTAKNRLRGIKSTPSSAKKALSTSKKMPKKRRLSEIQTPPQIQTSSISKLKQPQTLPSRPKQPVFNPSSSATQRKSSDSKEPRNFWSALPDDPFYDPMWQDRHPDGEPAFEEFERRRVLLEGYKIKKMDQADSLDDDLIVLSSPVAAKKTPTSKTYQTPETKEKKTPRSTRRIKKEEDTFESKLHTPRSGKFLEHLQKRLAEEKDAVKKEETEEATNGDDPSSKPENAAPEAPMPKIKNEYGLSDSEDELAREIWFVKDKDVEVVGTRKQKRVGRPKGRAPPLVVRETPTRPFTPQKSNGIKTEENEVTNPNDKPFATCGDPGYRCEKTICFTCIEDWDR
ncbi:hypothetical protein TWF694_008497 [Orbilia ellipsospora]|uniref:Uncharacterized protein n=1 Tax=Orbilia ellipsospora TaxID=2528407 RepID=A0AAV9XIX7_9PEZI